MIDAMKQALEWIEAQPDPRMITAGAVCVALRQAIEQAEKQTSAAKFWQGVYPDGWTAERVEAEMTDYYNLLDGMDSLIDYVTGGAISKPLTDKSVIRMKHDEHVNKMIEEAIQEATLQEISDIGQKIEPASRLYSIEPHGNGYAIYCGRSLFHHGMNIGHLTEVTPAAIKLIEDALNQKTGLEKQEPVMEVQSFGERQVFVLLKPLRDGDKLYAAPPKREQAEKQNPIAWLESSDWGELFVSRERIGSFPVFTAPPKREWVGLTDEDILNVADPFGAFQYGDAQGHKRIEFARAILALAKEKNT